MDFSSLSAREALKTLRRQERDRTRLIKNYFNEDISDPLLYDAVWNTDRVPVEVIAATLVPMIAHRVRLSHWT
jgi:cytidylate kinase